MHGNPAAESCTRVPQIELHQLWSVKGTVVMNSHLMRRQTAYICAMPNWMQIYWSAECIRKGVAT